MTDKGRVRVLIYSDCTFFAGCENMPANLLNSKELAGEFDLAFAYRYSAGYASGLSARVRPEAKRIPVRIPAAESVVQALDNPGRRWLLHALRLTGIIFGLRLVFALYAGCVLFFLFRKLRPDILHINNGGYPGAYSCVAAVFAAKAAGIRRVVFAVNNIAVPYTSLTRKLEKGIDGFVARNVSLFITGSSYAGAKLRDVLGLPDGAVRTIPNGIAARAGREPAQDVRRRLRIPDEALVLGVVAVLEPRKGHKFLLEAMSLLKTTSPVLSGAVLVIEGTGSEKERLVKLAEELGLGGNVRFIGSEANVFDVVRMFDVFVLPSVGYEDFPNVILEAMSLGKPVIGTRLAGIPEQIIDGETGLIVEPADAGALAGALARLSAGPDLREAMGRRGLERFNALFESSKAVGNYAALYRGLMTKPDGRNV